jgi:hypothetical protein
MRILVTKRPPARPRRRWGKALKIDLRQMAQGEWVDNGPVIFCRYLVLATLILRFACRIRLDYCSWEIHVSESVDVISSHLLVRQGQRMRKNVWWRQLFYNLCRLFHSLFLLFVARDVFQRTIHIVGFRVLTFKYLQEHILQLKVET